jgi:hypothetical protein
MPGKCPLYAVSCGELALQAGSLENQLNEILEVSFICSITITLD